MPRTINRLEAVATIGIDMGKNTFHLVGLDRNGAIVLRQKLSRRQVAARLANMPPLPHRHGAVRWGASPELVQIACVMEHCCISVWRFVFRQSLSFQLRLLRKQMVDNHADCDASNWH